MKKGFTLIELLAVIVILAIIALIATPIVLNIISDTKESAQLRSADFYLDAVEFSVANSTLNNKKITSGTYSIMKDGNICLGTLTNNTCDGEILEVEVKGETPSSGTITILDGEIDLIDLTYGKNIIVKNETGQLVYSNSSCTIQRQEDGKYTVGDIITCGEEQFYVIEYQDNDKTEGIDMLSKYNITLSTANPQQSSSAEKLIFYPNTTATGRDPYLYNSESNLYPYVEAYKDVLEENGVNVIDAKLLSYEQIISLWCVDDDPYIQCSPEENSWSGTGIVGSAPSWVYSTDYWLGSTRYSNTWAIYTSGTGLQEIVGESSSSVGIRPVITIPESELR